MSLSPIEDGAAEAELPAVGSLFDDSGDDAAEQQAGVVAPTATMMDLAEPDVVPSEHPDSPPTSEVHVEDYVVFFEKTVPMLDISIVASHGRFLLARSQSRYYVCDPAANRWLALPPSTIAPDRDANSGLQYHVDVSTGNTVFTVVLLLPRRLRRGLVETFSSTTGTWNVRELRSEGVARCLGAASPGVHVGTCFYWLSRRKGRIVRYDAARGRASVLREPPEAEQSKCRVGRALGTVGARLLLCAFDIRDEKSDSMLPHDGLEGVHGVWLMEGVSAARPSWARGSACTRRWWRTYRCGTSSRCTTTSRRWTSPVRAASSSWWTRASACCGTTLRAATRYSSSASTETPPGSARSTAATTRSPSSGEIKDPS